MIKIIGNIDCGGDGGTIQSVSGNNLVGNNISSNISNVLGKKSISVKKPFILGSSKLGEGGTYADSFPYFISRQLSDSNGVFANSFTVTISGTDIDKFVIAFDTLDNGFPKSITVDGNVFVDDDSIWEVVCEKANTHTIVISNWNKPNSNMIISSIYSDINIEINNNLISFDTEIMETSNMDLPSYGVISNSSSLTVSDTSEQILDLITQQQIHSGNKVTMYLLKEDNENSSSGGSGSNGSNGDGWQKQICEMYINDLDYDNDNKQAIISLKDIIEQWQDINVEPINYDPSNPHTETAKYFYDYLYEITDGLGFEFEPLDNDTLKVLNETVIDFPLLDGADLWTEWDKLCQACLLNIYVNNMNKVVVRHNII